MPCFVLVMDVVCDGAYVCTSELPMCPYARCKLAEFALHLMFVKLARGGRHLSPYPLKVERNACFNGNYSGALMSINKYANCFSYIIKL